MSMRAKRCSAVAVTAAFLVLAPAAAESEMVIFDAHIHYSQDVWESLPPSRALELLSQAGIARAIVSSTPTDGTERLYLAAPGRVVPFLRPYPSEADRRTWFGDPAIPAYVRKHLNRIPYRGIGEFHVFGDDARTDVVAGNVALARERGLALHVHTDLGGMEVLLEQAPDAPTIWAHGGFDVPEATLRRLLATHPQLYVELSFREGITDQGRLNPVWRALFMDFRRRFLVGTDTYIPSRWLDLPRLAEEARQWLRQLPGDVASDIAYNNAARLFGADGKATAAVAEPEGKAHTAGGG